jgi:hypothetical protein
MHPTHPRVTGLLSMAPATLTAGAMSMATLPALTSLTFVPAIRPRAMPPMRPATLPSPIPPSPTPPPTRATHFRSPIPAPAVTT